MCPAWQLYHSDRGVCCSHPESVTVAAMPPTRPTVQDVGTLSCSGHVCCKHNMCSWAGEGKQPTQKEGIAQRLLTQPGMHASWQAHTPQRTCYSMDPEATGPPLTHIMMKPHKVTRLQPHQAMPALSSMTTARVDQATISHKAGQVHKLGWQPQQTWCGGKQHTSPPPWPLQTMA